MKIYIGSDHAGFELKEKIKIYLKRIKVQFEDVGNHEFDAVDDYPLYAIEVAQKVAKNRKSKGILLCGNGVGVCMVANKFKGIRAVNASTVSLARQSREDDDTNILCLGGRILNYEQSKKIIKAWLRAEMKMDKKYSRRLRQFKHLGSK